MFSLVKHLSLNVIHETYLPWCFEQHSSTKLLSIKQSPDPVTKADISYKLLSICNSSCEECKSFHEVAQYLLTSGVLKSLICNGSKIDGGLGKHEWFFSLLMLFKCILLKHHAAWMWQVVCGTPRTPADFSVYVPTVGHEKHSLCSHTFCPAMVSNKGTGR